MRLRILLNVPLNPFSGYGNDGIGLTRALVKAGHDVYLSPVIVKPPIPSDLVHLFSKQLDPPFDVLLSHVDPLNLHVPKAAIATCRHRIGWTMWEYTSLKHARGWSKYERAAGAFHDILCYDPITREALQPLTPKKTRLSILQGGYEPERWPEIKDRVWPAKGSGQPFRFFMEGMLSTRKDPFIAIEAFNRLKHDGDFDEAELHVKDSGNAIPAELGEVIPKLKVHHGTWSEEKLTDFYRGCHVLLSPSRGEGKNMPALQFLSTGGTVAVTNWAGHTMWLHTDIGYGLDYTLASVDGTESMNARVSVEEMMRAMRHVYDNRGEARQKGSRAASLIPAMCSWDKVVRDLEERVIRPRF